MRNRTDYIVIHCSATPPSAHVDAKEIDRWHRQKGWLKIGYHFVITRDGVLQKGRDLDEVGAHVKGYNHKSIGICMVGGSMADDRTTPQNENYIAENNFTPAQWFVLEAILNDMKVLFPAAKIVGHKELEPAKQCPSFDVQEWLITKGVSNG